MNYCSDCGASLRRGIPEGDDRPRHICDACGAIHYQNPKIIAGCLPVWRDRILLCKRAIEPRLGYWTLPAGYMELGETLEQAASREAREEANVEVEIDGLYAIFNLPHISQVQVFFRARLIEERYSAGSESLEARLFREDDIPWEELSFETVRRSLRHFYSDRREGGFVFRLEEVIPERSFRSINKI